MLSALERGARACAESSKPRSRKRSVTELVCSSRVLRVCVYCVSCVSDGLCVCSFVSVVVCVSPSKICVCTARNSYSGGFATANGRRVMAAQDGAPGRTSRGGSPRVSQGMPQVDGAKSALKFVAQSEIGAVVGASRRDG